MEARDLLKCYLETVEDELRSILSRSSLAFWLHVYRRLYPGPIGSDSNPVSIGLTRAVLEAGIQKYGTSELCNRIALGTDVPIERVLGGVLLSPVFAPEREHIMQNPRQLILADFGPVDLIELYTAEKLAFEIWRIGATLRTIGKGASLVVADDLPYYCDNRNKELDWLIQHYDNRNRNEPTTLTAVVYEDVSSTSNSGVVLLPAYNLGSRFGKEWAKLYDQASGGMIHYDDQMKFNFEWWPYALRSYRDSHMPLAKSISDKYGVSIDAVLLVVASLWSRLYQIWINTHGMAMIRSWQRAYEGPYKWQYIRDDIRGFVADGAKILGVDEGTITTVEYEKALEFWTLDPMKREDIDLVYSGRHDVFLPCGSDRWFIDYAWLDRRLYDLFVGVNIQDQNFKGGALEKRVRRVASVLPIGPCKASDGTIMQVDAAYAVDEHLVVVECKAVARSIGYERGDPEAITYRRRVVVDRLLDEADEKAHWLASHPIGRNYRLDGYRDILPIGVSPFVEFLPSRSIRYWISEEVPRVLSPGELDEILSSTALVGSAWNRIVVQSPPY